ncbi:MAG: PEGA domain-containing protein [Deinococcales bacterium]
MNVSSAYSGIQVFVNGSPMGVTPLAAPIALLPNLYTITFKRQGQADISKNVQIYANQVESVQIP